MLRAMESLNARERHILELKYWSGLSNKEIAALLDLRAGNVGIILFRAIEKLKKILVKTETPAK